MAVRPQAGGSDPVPAATSPMRSGLSSAIQNSGRKVCLRSVSVHSDLKRYPSMQDDAERRCGEAPCGRASYGLGLVERQQQAPDLTRHTHTVVAHAPACVRPTAAGIRVGRHFRNRAATQRASA